MADGNLPAIFVGMSVNIDAKPAQHSLGVVTCQYFFFNDSFSIGV